MNELELLQAGINAARSGNTEQAQQLLVRLLQIDPKSEEGWYWMGLSLNDKEKREYCFRRVLALNPNHIEARSALSKLSKPISSAQIFPESNLESTPVQPAIEPKQKPVPVLPPQLKKEPPKTQKPVKKKIPWLAVSISVLLLCLLITAGVAFGPTLLNSLTPAEATPFSPTAEIPATATVISSPTPDISYTPTFEPSDCKIKVPNGVKVDCGYVVVPEDPSTSITKTIRIAVAVYRSSNPSAAHDPLIFIQGGPGASALDWAEGSYENLIAPLSQNRDFIVFDPRGVGKSLPSLECRELAITYAQELQGKIPADQRITYYQGALQTCRTVLTNQGINLLAHNSEASARDVVDIITALGYQQANIYGVSYGTRVAQLILKEYPEKIRSVIFDSVVPLEVNMVDEGAANEEHARQVLFSACAADPSCASAYPQLETTYLDTVAKLDAAPITLDVTTPEGTTNPQTVNGASFKNVLQWSLWASPLVQFTPQLIDRTSKGDYSFLQYVLSLPAYNYAGINLGTYITVNCREQVFSSATRALDDTIFKLCQQWLGTSFSKAGKYEPLVSDIPALVLAGKFDPVTPPAYSSQLAARLSHGFFYEFPALGHAPSGSDTTGCAVKFISEFLQDLATKPGDTCLAAINFSVPYTGHPPATLGLVNLANSNLTTVVPSGWKDVGFGFYDRTTVPLDITQLGIQQSTANETEWITWLSTQFNGKAGFDGQPTANGTHAANGLTWHLYKTTCKGNPVDIAFARSGNQTLMVLLQGYSNEHDPNFSTIFLPVIEGTHLTK